MTSSMLNGERRWASSTRRGGMTVLGKVAVPKPINLPSQRLENHGLNPDVEIVPNWGSKSPSSALNAWGSSLSPNTSCGTSSPSQLSARPSSGGSGTRPSTSGSDRTSEQTTAAWGSNSRPSSSSGVPTSRQTSQTSLRPRSAETRPGSSELSRFAEHATENSVAWDVARTTEKLGIKQCKNDSFSLSSGDFPTLGSEKDKSEPDFESQDQGSHIRPDSSAVLGKEKNETSTVDDVPVHANTKCGTENSWRRDDQAFNEDGMRPGIEKWQGNLHPYPNAGILPQHFDVWRGAPVNNHQRDFWFRGPPNGPFATPVAPGGFPIEPFPFYRPQFPHTGFANPPQVPPPGSGPRGQHNNGEVYRPHMPDAYIPPGMPLRPGFFPGPMAYEAYYGPPMGYCNSNERDVPLMGMATGASVYNRNPIHNPPEPGISHGRSGGHGPVVKSLASEPVESSHTPDTRPYRVLLKQHNELDGKNEPTTNLEGSLTTNASHANERDQSRLPVQENDHRGNMEMDLRRISAHSKEASSQTSGNQGSISVKNTKSLESAGSFDNISERKVDVVSSNKLGIASRPSAPKDSTLIQKIEGLNAKARDISSTKSKDDRMNKFHTGSQMDNDASAGVVSLETTLATEVKNPTVRGVGAFGGEKNLKSSTFSETPTSRQVSHGMHGRRNHRKGRLDTQDVDGWQKKSGVIDSSSSSGTQWEASSILVGEHQISVDAYERSGSYSQVRREGVSVQISDSANSHEQHAMTKELSKQQTKQLQVEEEEQTKKQWAKSLVKLEEVNRRTEAVEGSMQKAYAANSPPQNRQEFQLSESATVLRESGNANSSVMPSDDGACQNVMNPNQSATLYQNVNCADATKSLQSQNNVASKQRRTGYKQKQNLSDPMAYVNVSSSIATNEVSSALPMNSISMVESHGNQKKRNNRNKKNKQKVKDISFLPALPTAMLKEADLSSSSVENKPREDIELDQGSLQSSSLYKDPNQYSEQKFSLIEESYGRTNNLLKSQHSRRMPRNMQANRLTEKSRGSDALMWAPVKLPNKGILDESSEKSKIEAIVPAKSEQQVILDESSEKSKIEVIVPAKSEQQVHNLRNKRAEMERYIPKPIAKEMAQQGSSQQTVSSISQVLTDECVEKVDSGSEGPQITQNTISGAEIVSSVLESKIGVSRQTRVGKGKSHGSWRQRNSTESKDVHDMLDGVNHGSDSYQNIQIPMERQKVQMSETRGQWKHANNTSKPDASNNLENHDSAVSVSVPIIKDHKGTVRERQPFRRQKGTGVNHDVDPPKRAGGTRKTETLISSSVPDMNAVLKENQSIGDRGSSHWQPKFQSSNNQRGDRPKRKEFTHGGSFPDSIDKDSSFLAAQPPRQPVSENSMDREAPNFGNVDVKRESRNAPPEGHSHSLNQVAVSSSEQAPTSMGPRIQHHPSSGVRRNGNQSHFGKEREFREDWKTHAQDNRYHQNRERQGPPPNYHHEYHSLGPHGDSKSDNFERPKDGYYQARGRFRERDQIHSRRGGGN
ncbi:protein MODIFIER OF SNC1 1-like isoform X2 [Vicia villosa]|uniref:protein MODIFIER OF SNC1 1-like isoform X2 n=1 Tax=Vicia villosa TaxID=3911 RepID=UPI00273C8555|nr:protein MODIFIER OF SNC1 1-like isoform X2 [Vicia villosa]